MRTQVKNEVVKCFERELSARWPHFAPVPSERNFKTWAWRLAPNMTLFLVVQTLEKRDQFVVEVAWSEDGAFPWHTVAKADASGRQGRERLSRLWDRGPDEPLWDAAPEATAAIKQDLEALRDGRRMTLATDVPLAEVLPRVPKLVADAVQKIEQYGIPLFHQVAAARQLQWPQ